MSDYFPPQKKLGFNPHFPPEEVLIEILSRLPVKSLIKFRCVCRSWCSLIESPNFIKIHLNNQTKTNNRLLLIRYMSPNSRIEQYSLRSGNDAKKLKCPFDAYVYFRIVGICNGLVCLSDDKFTYTYDFIIWNPAIKRYLYLPKPSVNFDACGTYMDALGFGFDSKRNDYKVVRLAYLSDTEEKFGGFCDTPIVEIYGLRARSWRTKNSGVPKVSIVDNVWTQAFVNGSVHWAAFEKEKEDGGVRNVILAFDLAEEKFGVMGYPEALADDFPLKFTVGSHRESLALFAYDDRANCTCVEVYAMEEYGVADSWRKIHRVADIDGGIGMVVGFRVDGVMLLTTKANELVCYEPERNSVKKLGIRGVKESVYAGDYAESLVLLNGSKEESEVKAYKNTVFSVDAAKKKRRVSERFVADEVDMRYMFATNSIPGYAMSDRELLSSRLGMKAFFTTMARIFGMYRD